MRKKLVDAIASEVGVTKVQAGKAIRVIAKVVKAELAAGNDARLFGIGRIYSVLRASRVAAGAMTPNGGAPLVIPARKAIKFSPKTCLLAAVRGE